MKKIIISLLLTSILLTIYGQNAIRIYSGANVSNVKFFIRDNLNNTDTSYFRKDYILLPNLGLDIEFKINNKSSFISGLGVFWMGSKNFNDLPPNGINLDKDLILGYLRVPINFKYYLSQNFTVLGGTSFNYNFRKNQGFFALADNGTAESIYSPYQLAYNVGLEQRIQKIILHLSYQQGFTRIFDSRDVHTNTRVFLTSTALIFNIGYIIE